MLFISDKRIDYYGDPLRDFGLPHFLERFSFKNPKKLDHEKKSTSVVSHKQYVSYGTRGLPVKSLTRNNCSSEEMFIFNYLEQKRKQSSISNKSADGNEQETEEEVLKGGDVNDDEFEDYLDGFFGKKSTKKGKNEKDVYDDEEIDFLKEFEGALGTDSGKKTKKKHVAEDEDNDIDNDWGDDDDDDKEDSAGNDISEDEEASVDFNDDASDEDASISLDETDYYDGEVNSDSDSNDSEPKPKKSRRNSLPEIDERSFNKKLKHSDGKILLTYNLKFKVKFLILYILNFRFEFIVCGC